MQTSIRLFLYIYHYLTDSAFVVLIALLRARARYIIFNFFLSLLSPNKLTTSFSMS